MDKSCPIDIDELYELLHREGGVLVDLFKSESIDVRKRKLGDSTYPHLPTKRCSDNFRETVPHRGECGKCKNATSTWLSTFLPLRAAVSHYYHLYGGRENGLAMCIIWTDAKFWLELSLLLDQPEMIFAITTEMQNRRWRNGRRCIRTLPYASIVRLYPSGTV